MKRYIPSTSWTFGIETRGKKKIFYLENQYKGRIIIDEQIKKILQSIRRHTLEEIYQVHRELLEKVVEERGDVGFNISPLRLLEDILNVFIRAWIMKRSMTDSPHQDL